jgi:hypothetical protein
LNAISVLDFLGRTLSGRRFREKAKAIEQLTEYRDRTVKFDGHP